MEAPTPQALTVAKAEASKKKPVFKTHEYKMERYYYDWLILNFDTYFPELSKDFRRPVRDEKGTQVTSDLELISKEFMCGQFVGKVCTWQLELRRKGAHLCVALSCLNCLHPEVTEVWTRFDIDLVNFAGEIIHSEGGASFFSCQNLTKFTPRTKVSASKADAQAQGQNPYWEMDVVSLHDLTKKWKELVPRNILCLRLRLYVFKDKPFNESNDFADFHAVKLCYSENSLYTATNQFMQAIKLLWESKENSDVKIEIGGHVIKAHKFVLSVQSPILKSMLDSASTSTRPGSDITLKITKPFPIFEVMIKHLYTQDGEDIKSSTDITFISRVLQLCDEFEVKTLSRICLVRLIINMTVENFGETSIAIFRNVKQKGSFFRTEVKRFLLQNQEAIRSSQEFKTHAKANQDLFLELCFQPLHLLKDLQVNLEKVQL